eukprot:63035-Chlamydomonas_euryale.AAC.6
MPTARAVPGLNVWLLLSGPTTSNQIHLRRTSAIGPPFADGTGGLGVAPPDPHTQQKGTRSSPYTHISVRVPSTLCADPPHPEPLSSSSKHSANHLSKLPAKYSYPYASGLFWQQGWGHDPRVDPESCRLCLGEVPCMTAATTGGYMHMAC